MTITIVLVDTSDDGQLKPVILAFKDAVERMLRSMVADMPQLNAVMRVEE